MTERATIMNDKEWLQHYEKYDLIIFDWDDTLCRCWTGEPLPNRRKYIKLLKQAGKRFSIASNQSGVNYGYRTESEVFGVFADDATALKLPKPTYWAVCFARTDSGDRRRKPMPGMLLEIMRHFDASPERTLFVGDWQTDEEAAKNAGVDFEWANVFFGGQ